MKKRLVADAKQEAARIIARANTEAELEKQKAADEVKQQIIAVARLMASKVVAESISEADRAIIVLPKELKIYSLLPDNF